MLDREVRGFEARVRKLTRTIGHADLTAAVNGTAQALSIGTMPPGAVKLGRAVTLNTFFTGGAASAVGLQLGISGDPDSIMTSLNVFDTTTNDVPVQGTAGVSPVGPAGGEEVLATFTPDGGHTLAGLDAGELTVEIYFAVPDAGV